MRAATLTIAIALAACGNSSPIGGSSAGGANTPPQSSDNPSTPAVIDRHCDDAPFPSELWLACEAENFAKVGEAPAEQARNPDFLLTWQEQGRANFEEWVARAAADPSWLGLPSGNSPQTPLCTTWGMQCAGDPYRYPASFGPDGAAFYSGEAQVIPFVIYDEGCARLSGA